MHTSVGAGAGLLIGLALSGAAIGGNEATVVLTWTGIGAAAGLVSGLLTAAIGAGT